MKRITMLILFINFMCGSAVYAQEGFVSQKSSYDAEETAVRPSDKLQENSITIFERVNHHVGAERAGMELNPTILILFGNPNLGTPIMQCAQTAAIDLPQKMLIWTDDEGATYISYNDTIFIKKRHRIEGCDKELEKISSALKRFAGYAAGNDS